MPRGHGQMVRGHNHFSRHYWIDPAFRFALAEVCAQAVSLRVFRPAGLQMQGARIAPPTPARLFATTQNLRVLCHRCSRLPASFPRSKETCTRRDRHHCSRCPNPSLPVLADNPLPALGPESNPLWLRYPAISPDGTTIAFSFRGHIFTVPAAGGLAIPLTGGPAHDSSPVWSPDGKLIAFASDRYGHYDVYVTSPQGGAVRRLTTYSTDAVPTSFTPDGQYVLFNAYRMGTAQSCVVSGQDFSTTLQGIDPRRTRTRDALDDPGIERTLRPSWKSDSLRGLERIRRSMAKT